MLATIPNQPPRGDYSRCECHECTQVRWKMSSGQWQQSQTMVNPHGLTGLIPPEAFQGQKLRTEDEKQAHVRESINKQLSNS